MESVSRKIEHIGWSSAVTALVISALWGGNVIALKIGLATLPPVWSAFWRFLTGFVAVVLWARAEGIPLKPEPGESVPLGILGVLFTLQIAGLNVAVNSTSPAYAVVLLNSHPIFTNLISHFWVAEDRLSRQRILGLAIAFSGICYLALGRPDAHLAPHPILGNVIIVISAVLLAARMVYTQRLVQTIEPVRPVVWQMAFSLPVFLGTALWLEPMTLQPLTAVPVLAILYQGVAIAGLCFVVWTRLLQRHSPGVVVGVWFLGAGVWRAAECLHLRRDDNGPRAGRHGRGYGGNRDRDLAALANCGGGKRAGGRRGAGGSPAVETGAPACRSPWNGETSQYGL